MDFKDIMEKYLLISHKESEPQNLPRKYVVDGTTEYWENALTNTKTEDQYLVGFGKILTSTTKNYEVEILNEDGSTEKVQDSTMTYRCNLIGDKTFYLPRYRFFNDEECIKFCLAYQYVMANLINCKKDDVETFEYWRAKKEQLKNDLMCQNPTNLLDYFESEEGFEKFCAKAREKYDKKQNNKAPKTRNKVFSSLVQAIFQGNFETAKTKMNEIKTNTKEKLEKLKITKEKVNKFKENMSERMFEYRVKKQEQKAKKQDYKERTSFCR